MGHNETYITPEVEKYFVELEGMLCTSTRIDVENTLPDYTPSDGSWE